ncbi:Dipeptidyl-peptidase 5 [bacterium HR18]|uniref:WD40 domain protein beta Propeller n=1 Tax=Rhodothermus marinus TaxID=29549 RepID=A0A7V2B2R6_RHOMR|nr:Dipeptidyl-peptidase 5 [bacterium HR18]
MLSVRLVLVCCLGTLPACMPNSSSKRADYDPATDSLRFPGEVHLRNIRQLTFGGNNAEAYWSYDDRYLVFQSDWTAINPQGCDQIFLMRADGQPLADGQRYRLLSTGRGRTTCAYFLPNSRVLYASTHAAGPECPPVLRSVEGRYVWSLYEYDIYVTDTTGAPPELLIGGPGYDAEATVSPDGRYIVFTSSRSGDLELWRYDLQTGALLQLTQELGYDGGAFFSPDGSQIVWRASRPTGEAAKRYRQLLAQGLVEPSEMDLYVANADGSNPRRVTHLPGAQWAPYFHPDGKRIIFASNHHTKGGRLFDLFLIQLDGTGLAQVTHSGTFDAFPMFSRDGRRLVFASNRNARGEASRETNLFVADWVEHPEPIDLSFTRP